MPLPVHFGSEDDPAISWEHASMLPASVLPHNGYQIITEHVEHGIRLLYKYNGLYNDIQFFENIILELY